jgi:uncharacterized membrane protein
MWLVVTMLWLPWVGLALWLARQMALRRSINGSESPEDLAKRAYAKGDITRDRFMEMMADLSTGAASGSLH